MTGFPFTKMHGLGNDFVVFDARHAPLALDGARVRAIAERRTGIGCDQVIAVEQRRNGGTDAYLRFWNRDGGEVAACGNGTRCAARLLLDEGARTSVVLETGAGRLTAQEAGGGQVRVDMGPARLGWREIPLARAMDTLHVALGAGPLGDAVAVNMGNPHAVFFVDDADAVPLARLGPDLETDPLFPEHANIGVAQRLASDRLRLRVWERGVGLTNACGTGACAAGVAGARRGLTGRSVAVVLDGGELGILWRDDGHVEMTGPTAASFSGVLPA
ncbi:MAG: diaminopimelate epimerase [Rhodospirillales bacterium]|nr:diaminopimelate epimerase [Rhodospirillales bacterium]MDE0379749.1 diaminopimelate epimerase [Rhodospirillales bacterium]